MKNILLSLCLLFSVSTVAVLAEEEALPKDISTLTTTQEKIAAGIETILADLYTATKEVASSASKELSALAEEIIIFGVVKHGLVSLFALLMLYLTYVFAIKAHSSGIGGAAGFEKYQKFLAKVEILVKDEELECNKEIKRKEYISSEEGRLYFLRVFFVWCSIVSFILFCVNITEIVDVLKAVFAPRLYLLEQVSQLVKSV